MSKMIESDKNNKIRILLIEDNIADVRLLNEAMLEVGCKCQLDRVKNGLEAIDFLRKQGNYKDAKRPDIIFLDLNLPVINGKKLLDEIKKDNSLKFIPIIVLTSSEDMQDVNDAYYYQANAFISKPIDFEKLLNIVSSIGAFWIKTAVTFRD